MIMLTTQPRRSTSVRIVMKASSLALENISQTRRSFNLLRCVSNSIYPFLPALLSRSTITTNITTTTTIVTTTTTITATTTSYHYTIILFLPFLLLLRVSSYNF